MFHQLSTPRESGSLFPNNADKIWLDMCAPELITMTKEMECYDWPSLGHMPIPRSEDDIITIQSIN